MARALQSRPPQPPAAAGAWRMRAWRPVAAFGLVSLALAVLVILMERSSLPGVAAWLYAFRRLGPIALAALLLLAGSVTLVLLLMPDARESALWEEPLLPLPAVPAVRGRSALIGLLALEAGAGASSLAFNLAVLIAAEGGCIEEGGSRRRPRPLCLLSEGRLTEVLGLDPKPLRLHVESLAGRINEEVIDLAWRHPSGCELLCAPRGLIDRHRLRLLRLAVERHYEVILVDAGAQDSWLQEAAQDVSDALLLIALPTEQSLAAAAAAAEQAQMLHLLPRTTLVVNRLRSSSIRPEHLKPFHHHAFLPEDSSVLAAEDDAQDERLPWSILPGSAAALQLQRLAFQLLPDTFRRPVDAT